MENANNIQVVSQVEFRNGRPVVVFRGKPMPQLKYSDPMVMREFGEEWIGRSDQMIREGVHIHTLQPLTGIDGGHWFETRYWTADGVYPDCVPDMSILDLDRQAALLIERDPVVLFYVRIGDHFPMAWYRANPDHMQQCGISTGEFIQPSYASEKALDDVAVFLDKLVRYCESQSWADRIIGYLYFPLGEGILQMTITTGKLFERSPAMQQAYKRFLKNRYETDGALRTAWGGGDWSLETVEVPADEEWAEMRLRTTHWPDTTEFRRARDYFLLQRELFLRWNNRVLQTIADAMLPKKRVVAVDSVKQTMMGWQIKLAFTGTGPAADFPDLFLATGSLGLKELIENPNLDMLITPADYTARMVGFGFESEGVADSLHLVGKTILVENDCRTFSTDDVSNQGAFRNAAEVRAGMIRNSAWSLTRGHFDYWMNIGMGFFKDERVRESGVRPLIKPLHNAWKIPHIETEHAIAMVIDDEAALLENGTSGYQNLAILWQRVHGLSHSGIPYRIYLLSDLYRENMPDYRCWLFPNLFLLNEERLALLERKVLRDGRMAVFGPATGITDGSRFSADWASRLFGVEMELIRKEPPRRVVVNGRDSVTRNLSSSLVYGDSLPYGPVLIPADGALERGGARELGMAVAWWEVNRPGLFVRDTGNAKIAWSAAVPLPGCLLRELAREGGCHVWCEEDDVVFASETIAAIHTIKQGPRTLKLPSARPVWDMVSGEKISDNTAEIQMTMESPETRLFYLGEELPY